MLINKNAYSTGDVLVFKLTNGDECVAKLVEQTETEFVVTKPCTVIPGAKGIALVQSLFTGKLDVDIRISKKHIIMSAPVVKEMEKYYLETTSGIQIATGAM
jgi:hypothetical protein